MTEHVCKCSHARESHYKEMAPATEIVRGQARPMQKADYFACLATFCTCEKYKSESAEA